jgi:hypothetical protein
MMAENQKVEYLPPAEYQTRSPLDYAKINPAGIGTDPKITESFNAANEATKAYANSLEQRFSQPNWFKIASGFAKPQLGGFLASLGSASQELGQQQEALKAIEPSISRMRAEVASGQLGFDQRMKQKKLLDEWRRTGKPMDASTFENITSYGAETDVAKAARAYYEGAKESLGLVGGAAEISAKYPQIGTSLDEFTKFQLKPNVDESAIEKSRVDYINKLSNAMPPQMDKTTWMALSIPDKQKAVDEYGRRQLEAGMNTEAGLQQQASQVPSRLALLGSVRDLAMGVGLKEVEKDGKTISGRDQMAGLLNYFGGNNPFEVLARAAADGKLGDKLADIDTYARQNAMSPQARDQFQKLAKLLAENQVNLRNGALNPTDQFSALQMAGQPNIGNSQTALISLVDLMAHGEKNTLDKYRYVLDNNVPFRQLGIDPEYLAKQAEYAREHRRIATSNPFESTPSWYNPAVGSKPAVTSKPVASENPKPEAQANKPSQSTARRIRSADDILREAGVKP